MSQNKHWSDIDESTTVAGVRILVFLYRIGGRFLFRIALAPVIIIYYLTSRSARHAALDYLSRLHAFAPAQPAATSRNGFSMFWAFGNAILDKFAVLMGHIQRADLELHNYKVMEDLQEHNRGVILLTSHLGNFEVCRGLSKIDKGKKLTVLVHTKNAENFNRVLRSLDQEQKVELLQVSDVDIAMSIRLSEKLSNGEMIAIAGDRVPINSQATVEQSFLGSTAPFPSGPFVLASSLGAPIVMMTCIRIQGRYNVFFDALSNGEKLSRSERKQRLQSLSASYVKRLEHYVQMAPYQWFNFYSFWNRHG